MTKIRDAVELQLSAERRSTSLEAELVHAQESASASTKQHKTVEAGAAYVTERVAILTLRLLLMRVVVIAV